MKVLDDMLANGSSEKVRLIRRDFCGWRGFSQSCNPHDCTMDTPYTLRLCKQWPHLPSPKTTSTEKSGDVGSMSVQCVLETSPSPPKICGSRMVDLTYRKSMLGPLQQM